MRGDIHPEGKEKASTLCLHLIRTSHTDPPLNFGQQQQQEEKEREEVLEVVSLMVDHELFPSRTFQFTGKQKLVFGLEEQQHLNMTRQADRLLPEPPLRDG